MRAKSDSREIIDDSSGEIDAEGAYAPANAREAKSRREIEQMNMFRVAIGVEGMCDHAEKDEEELRCAVSRRRAMKKLAGSHFFLTPRPLTEARSRYQ